MSEARDYVAVNNAFNEGKPDALPAVLTNAEVTTYTKNCLSNIECDLHYELDWTYRLTATMTCDEATTKDPCFGTQACLCDNGYYRIALNMPTRPANYAGNDLYIEQAESRAATEAGETDPETGTETNVAVTTEEDEEWFGYPQW